MQLGMHCLRSRMYPVVGIVGAAKLGFNAVCLAEAASYIPQVATTRPTLSPLLSF